MSERPVELRAILIDIQRRWMRRFVLRAWALGATAATTVAPWPARSRPDQLVRFSLIFAAFPTRSRK